MDLVVRPADLTDDCEQIVALQRQYLSPRADLTRFHWLYQRNPFGQPQVWVTEESTTGAIIGVAAAFPRSLYIGSQKKVGWVLGDFCISEEYRSLGPAIQLQKACLDGLGVRGEVIWYDFPSTHMLAIYRRLKVSQSKQMIRFVKPLKVDRKMRAVVKSTLLQRSLSPLGNLALRIRDRRVASSPGLTIQQHTGDCGAEFTELADAIGGAHGHCLERTAAYLNWRYRQNPFERCIVITARREGNLKGYAVFTETETEEDVRILDVFGVEERDVMISLLEHIVERGRSGRSETVVVSIAEDHPWIPFLQSVGFKPREASPIIIAGLPVDSEHKTNDNQQRSLLLMQGDRDS
ncbi:MAG: hypothetical protein NPIRA02_15040 [Nitrospirales bacterium]|nr:MAG: hypothetical protein NPIRA02_15040 [Nitrospirales bacterium]